MLETFAGSYLSVFTMGAAGGNIRYNCIRYFDPCSDL
jgi:hypothetical protein